MRAAFIGLIFFGKTTNFSSAISIALTKTRFHPPTAPRSRPHPWRTKHCPWSIPHREPGAGDEINWYVARFALAERFELRP